MPGRPDQRVKGQLQQGAQYADLLIPYAVAAEACAGEAAEEQDPRHRFYRSVIALQRGDTEDGSRIAEVLEKSREVPEGQRDAGTSPRCEPDSTYTGTSYCELDSVYVGTGVWGLGNDSVDDEGALWFKGKLVIPAVRELI